MAVVVTVESFKMHDEDVDNVAVEVAVESFKMHDEDVDNCCSRG